MRYGGALHRAAEDAGEYCACSDSVECGLHRVEHSLWAHNVLVPRIVALLKEQRAEDILIGGGTIPQMDMPG